MRVLITGANGFIGKQLCHYLQSCGIDVFAVARQAVPFLGNDKQLIISDLAELRHAEKIELDAVVHLAAKVHDLGLQSSGEYHRVNVRGTEAVREFAERCSAKHFIFLSSVKALGEKTTTEPFSEYTVPAPEDDYGRSKWDAEQGLEVFAAKSDGKMKVSVVRIPLVYGIGVKANFLSLMRLVQKVPVLPFGCFDNQRSVLGVENLIDFIHQLLIGYAQLENYSCFCIADEKPLSTKELTNIMKLAIDDTRLIQLPIPVFILESIFKLLGKQAMLKRLSENLVVSWDKANSELGWTPKYSTFELIRKIYQG